MIKYFYLATMAFVLSFSVNAQSNWCFTDQYNEELLQSMSKEDAGRAVKERNRLFELASQSPEKSGVVYTIPVVVHVIHDNCVGNITKAQIETGIDVLNEDFRRLNSDTGNTRALFKPYAADAEIQFKLAQIDPNGNCTEGITRTSSELTYDANNSVKSLAYWPSNKYLNVWVVVSIAGSGPGIILGYAQFPGFGSWSTYGFVVRNDSWGRIGTARFDGRTASHEVGHCFGLYHTFQSGCGNNCNNSGDRICDTPPTFEATYGCNTNQNTCSNDANGSGNPYTSDVVDQIENIMSYDDCTNMFSQGQADLMRSTLNGITQLSQLISSSNLVATGTNPGFVANLCAPKADFCQEKISICEGTTVNFVDNSYNGDVTTRLWSFPGGTPASSSDSLVTVTYATPGVYSVTLNVGNSTGSSSVTNSNVINVISNSASMNSYGYHEEFEDKTQFEDNWTVVSPTGGRAWELTSKAAFTGSKSVYLNNNFNGFDQVDELISPSYNLKSVKDPIFTFQVAYAKKSSVSSDMLRIYYSYTCGKTWSIMGVEDADELNSTSGNVSGDFIPTKDPMEWKQVKINVPSFIRTKENLFIKLEFTSGGGNNIYIDDLRIQNVSGIADVTSIDFSVYPNPASDRLFVELGNNANQLSTIAIRDLSGRTLSVNQNQNSFSAGAVIELNISTLSKGIYFVVVSSTDGAETVKKVVIK